MRNLFIGIIIGMLFGGSIVYAATFRTLLINGNGKYISATYPLYINTN